MCMYTHMPEYPYVFGYEKESCYLSTKSLSKIAYNIYYFVYCFNLKKSYKLSFRIYCKNKHIL